MRFKAILFILLCSVALSAQVPVGPSIIYSTINPAGAACANTDLQWNVVGSGTIYTCQSNVYTQVSGGGGGSSFSALTSGTNTQAVMLVGTGSSLVPTGTGTVVSTLHEFLATASTGGTTQYLLVVYDGTTGNVTTAPIASAGIVGIAASTATSGNPLYVIDSGVTTCIADNTVTANHLLGVGSATAGRCKDLGSAQSNGIASNVSVIGRAVTGGSAGASITVQTVGAGHYGTLVVAASVNTSICSDNGCSQTAAHANNLPADLATQSSSSPAAATFTTVVAGATNPVTIGGATGSCTGKVATADGTGCVSQPTLSSLGAAASNAATTVNGQTCTLGSTCTVADATKLPLAGGVVTGPIGTNAEYDNGTCTTSKTITPVNGNRQKVALTNGNACAFTFTQPTTGTVNITLKIIQSAVSTYNGTITGCKWPGGTVPTITATTGAVDFVSIYLDGTTAYCVASQNFS